MLLTSYVEFGLRRPILGTFLGAVQFTLFENLRNMFLVLGAGIKLELGANDTCEEAGSESVESGRSNLISSATLTGLLGAGASERGIVPSGMIGGSTMVAIGPTVTVVGVDDRGCAGGVFLVTIFSSLSESTQVGRLTVVSTALSASWQVS